MEVYRVTVQGGDTFFTQSLPLVGQTVADNKEVEVETINGTDVTIHRYRHGAIVYYAQTEYREVK